MYIIVRDISKRNYIKMNKTEKVSFKDSEIPSDNMWRDLLSASLVSNIWDLMVHMRQQDPAYKPIP